MYELLGFFISYVSVRVDIIIHKAHHGLGVIEGKQTRKNNRLAQMVLSAPPKRPIDTLIGATGLLSKALSMRSRCPINGILQNTSVNNYITTRYAANHICY
jgi:hypothetical protein